MSYHYYPRQFGDMVEANEFAQAMHVYVREQLEKHTQKITDEDHEKKDLVDLLRSHATDSEIEFWQKAVKFVGYWQRFMDEPHSFHDVLVELVEWWLYAHSQDDVNARHKIDWHYYFEQEPKFNEYVPFHARCEHGHEGARCTKLLAHYWIEEVLEYEYKYAAPRYWHEISWYPGSETDSQQILWYLRVHKDRPEEYVVRCAEHAEA